MKRLTVVLLVILVGLAGSWLVGRAPRATAGIPAESGMGGTVSGDAGIAIEPVEAPPSRTLESRTAESALSEVVVEARSIAAFPARAADTTGALDLRVTWSDGTSAAQVSARLLPWGDDTPRRRSRVVTTDELGRVLVEGLSAGRVGVYLDRATGGTFDVAAGAVTLAEITMEAGFEVVGTVRDPEGRAIAGAELVLSDYANDGEAKVVGLSNERGEYRLRDVGESRSLSARAAGFAPGFLEPLEGYAPGEIYERDFVLQPGGAVLVGRVEDEEGLALGGARIRIQPAGSLISGGRRLKPHPIEFVSLADGTFESDVLGADHVAVHVRTDMHAPLTESIPLEPGERKEVVLTLHAGAIVEGTVLRADGSPASGARVTTSIGDRRWIFLGGSTKVDDRGKFRRQGIDPRHLQISAFEEEYGKVEGTISLTAGEITRWDAQLEAGRTVVGHVVDERGVGLDGWMVGTQSRRNLWDRRTNAGANGEFTLRDVRADARQLHVTVAGGWSVGSVATELIPPASNEAATVVIRVPDTARPSSRLRLRVLADGAAPTPPAQVFVRTESGFSDDHTDEDGEVELPWMKPGDAHVSVSLDGYATHHRDVEIPPDTTFDAGTVRLTRGGQVAVQYVRTEGHAELRIPTQVSIYDESGQSIAYFDVVDGEALSPRLEPGRYRFRPNSNVCAQPSEYATVTEGETTQATFMLLPGGRTRVMVSMEDGLEVPESLSVRVTDSAGDTVLHYESLVHSQKGATIPLSLSGLPPGVLTIAVNAPDGQRGTASVEVTYFGDDAPPAGGEITLR